MHHKLQKQNQIKLDQLLLTVDTKQVQATQRTITFKTSSWLPVLPTTYHHFDLSATDFCDADIIDPFWRCQQHVMDVVQLLATLYEHALDCKKGGLITRHHNEVRDTLGDLSSIAHKDIILEPVIQKACEVADESDLIADLGVQEVWQPQAQALFDVRVIDTDAPSLGTRPYMRIFSYMVWSPD